MNTGPRLLSLLCACLCICPSALAQEVIPIPATTAAMIAAAAPADVPRGGSNPRHVAKVEAVKSGTYELALIGDSITQNTEGFKPVWEKYYVPRKAINLGYSGYRTENILWNLDHGELDFTTSPKVFMLLIGTNNTDDQHYKTVHDADQVVAGTKAIVERIKARHPTSKILILRILPCGGPGDTSHAALKRIYNRSAAMMEVVRQAGERTATLADNKQVFWLDLTSVFRKPDGTLNSTLMPDLIHPNLEGAEAMAAAIKPTLDTLMQ